MLWLNYPNTLNRMLRQIGVGRQIYRKEQFSRGIVHPVYWVLIGGTIPHGFHLRKPSLLLATQTNRHLGRIKTSVGHDLHHDRVPQTEDLELSHQLLPPRQVLHPGGDPSVR